MSTNILLIGRSSKFEYVVKQAWPEALLTIISWRNTGFIEGSYDKIILCGYDYESYMHDYEKYINVNVYWQLHRLNKMNLSKADIIYINTYGIFNWYTFSRYVFAKLKLASLLTDNFNSVYILNVPTVLNNMMWKSSYSSINPLILDLLLKLKMVTVINTIELIELVKCYNLRSGPLRKCPMPFMLNIKRSIFIDRLMRLILG
ncbi:hypothetical protein LMORI2_02750 [Limnohabitans sp. MORI2]|uniref:hypothetical protein n=1 Tax=Limnohabitans sp. MORI2 TaxID=1751150 RepID=UPI0023772EC8|nr:hypothetical protein [Limnohabitans sp. MORI2]BDU57293.1 hypothetical protein LMORI2_02750 [Limnohabitans sp. MORI2]